MGNFIGFTNTTVIVDTNSEIDILYILGLANSQLLEYQHKRNAKQTGGGVYEYFPNTIERYPIEVTNRETQNSLVSIVRKIIIQKKSGIDTSEMEH